MLPVTVTVVAGPPEAPTGTAALLIWPAEAYLENEVRRRQHVRDLHAGEWSGPPPRWLYEDEER